VIFVEPPLSPFPLIPHHPAEIVHCIIVWMKPWYSGGKQGLAVGVCLHICLFFLIRLTYIPSERKGGDTSLAGGKIPFLGQQSTLIGQEGLATRGRTPAIM
jgi:hypothetical protein